MLRRTALLFVVLALSGCGLWAGPGGPSSDDLRVIRLPMGYIPNVQYAPFYVAVQRGYFAEEGLALDFDYSFETDGVKLVGANELSFTLASGEQVLLARAQGLPVICVYGWWQDYPVAIAAPADSGIVEPEDLVGKRIGIPLLGGASYIGYRALLSANGLPADAATLDVIGYNQVEALLAGQEDAVVIYANNEPMQLAAQGMQVNLIRVADYVHLASNGLVTNERTLHDDPELVRSMIRALDRGVRDVLDDPAAAFDTCLEYVEGLSEADQAVQRKVLEASIEFWRAEPTGTSPPASWENMQAVLLSTGLMERGVDLSRAFTNGYLP